MEKRILFNKMYTGSFTENNIGHEIINFFKDDNGDEYIYALPYGGIDKKHNPLKNGNKNQIEYILLTTPQKDGIFEILAKAKVDKQINLHGNCTPINFEDNKKVSDTDKKRFEENKIAHEEQLKLISGKDEINGKKKITYGGVPINEIFEKNIGNEMAIYVTFKVSSIIRAKRRIFICKKGMKDNIKNKIKDAVYEEIDLDLKRSKGYVIEGKSDYKIVMKKIIDESTYWKEYDDITKVDLKHERYKKYIDNSTFNFLKLIRKEDDENIFSNMFFYYFNKNKMLFNEFLEKCVKPSNAKISNNIDEAIKDNYFEVKKEKSLKDIEEKYKDELRKNFDNKEIKLEGRIDLWIEGNNNIFVIENKIKSGINGIDNNDKKITQLDRYYEYAEFYAKKHNYKKTNYLIFVPEYNKQSLIDYIETKDIKNGNKYTIISYKEIYDFFKNIEIRNYFKEDKDEYYFKDFINCLSKQIYTPDEEMERRFVLAIKDLQKNKS